MSIRASFLALMVCTTSAFAGDSVLSQPELEVLYPFIIETEDLRPLWMTAKDWAQQGVTEAMLWDFWTQDDPLPAPVPLGDSWPFLLAAMGAFPLMRKGART